jgi:hypothetical protein
MPALALDNDLWGWAISIDIHLPARAVAFHNDLRGGAISITVAWTLIDDSTSDNVCD